MANKTDDELTEKELKQIEADDQAIQTILLGLPEDIYAAVDSSPHQDQPSFNQNYMQQPMPNPEDITDPTTAMNMALTLITKAFKLNYSTPTNTNQRISSNPRNRQIAQPGMNMGQDKKMQMVGGNGGNQFRQYAWQNVGNLAGYNNVQNIGNQILNGNGNLVATRAEGNETGQNGNKIRCYNCRGVGHYARNYTVRPKRRDDAYLQTQLLIAQKEEAGLQLQTDEFDLMAAAADLDEIEEVNANYILMANLEQASTSGTQPDKAHVYDSDGSAEVHDYENCDDNEIFNMFTQEEQYTKLREPIPDQHQVPQNDNNVISEVTSVEQSGETIEQHPINFEETRALYDSLYQNLAFEVEKVNSSIYQEQCLSKKINALHLTTEKKKLKSDFKTREDKLLDKQIHLEKRIKELNNILVKTGQSIQTIHMLSPKPDSFYHTEQKMALGYQNPFYLKQAQKKQQRLYDGKVLLEKHDPLVVYDSKETLQLAQESREKMKQLNKEIKPANYTKINHLSGVFISQTAKSREELYFSNDSKTANVSKSISIPNEEFLDDTTPSVARKFLNEHKALELEIERLLRAVVSQDIISVVQKESVVDTSDLQTELERIKERFENCIIKKENEYAKLWNDWYKKCDECKYDKISYDKAYKDMQQKIERLQAQLKDLKGKSKDTSCVTDTRNPLFQKLESKNVELEFQVLNYARENAHLKATYKNLFDSISVSQTQTKIIKASLENELQSTIYKNAKLRTQLFKKVFDQKDNTHDTSANTKFAKQPIVENLPKVGESHALSKPVTSNSISTPQESKGVNNDMVIQICLWCVDSGCSKHMTGNLKLLINFVWKFMGTVRFRNDHVAAILGFGDLQWGNILITRVYFVDGLGYNMFSVGQFCDSDIEVTFRRNACFVRNLEGVDLLKGNHSTNLYTIILHEMASASPICLMAHASSTKSWLWPQRLSHLNFDTINDLSRNDLVLGLPKFKYHKEHLCPSCEQGKSKRASHPPKPVLNSRQRLHLLHMDLYGPMRITSINGKQYVLVIVDDYSRYTWVHFISSKDKAPEVIKTFLKRITILLQSPVIIIRTNNGTEFKNQVLKEYFDSVGISHQMSSVRTPQQNGIIE
nr:retrovirus-related Pol polyprotein from transposon TNT 1-94 [Tanacetum cinerariifolium]